MDLTQALNRIVVTKRATNRSRWRGQPGHYEAWYLTFNARPEQLGFWLRYTLEAPRHAPAFRELWAHVFDATFPERSFGLRERHRCRPPPHRSHALTTVGDSFLEEGRAVGHIRGEDHQVEWDLAFEPDPCAVHLAPFPVRALGLASTRVVFANPDARFRGRVVVDGRALSLAREPGSQTHLWGRKHAERWAWGHCSAFDGRDDCALDGVAAFLKRRGRVRGPLTGVYVRYRSRDYCLNALPQMLLTRSQVDFPVWRFEGCAHGLRFAGTFRGQPERMMQVTYTDPDGEPSYCANTEIADLELEIWHGRRLLDRLLASGTAHLEFGSRERQTQVRSTV